jgi:hypothetical protein
MAGGMKEKMPRCAWWRNEKRGMIKTGIMEHHRDNDKLLEREVIEQQVFMWIRRQPGNEERPSRCETVQVRAVWYPKKKSADRVSCRFSFLAQLKQRWNPWGVSFG